MGVAMFVHFSNTGLSNLIFIIVSRIFQRIFLIKRPGRLSFPARQKMRQGTTRLNPTQILFASFLVYFLSVGSSFAADVCPSGCAFSSIQSAIDAAAPSTTIMVGPGTYHENISIDKYLALKSVTGPSNTIIDASGLGLSAITINTYNQHAIIDGFTIMGGSSTVGAGLYINGRATIQNNIIKNNVAGHSGGGLRAMNMRDVTIEDNLFEANSAGREGGAIMLGGYATQTVNRNVFTNNSALHGGAVATLSYGYDTVKNNLFINNTKTLYLYSYANTKLANNTIIGSTGYAARKGSYGYMSMINGILWNNQENFQGWGWSVENSLVDVDPLFVDSANGATWCGPSP